MIGLSDEEIDFVRRVLARLRGEDEVARRAGGRDIARTAIKQRTLLIEAFAYELEVLKETIGDWYVLGYLKALEDVLLAAEAVMEENREPSTP